MSIRRQMSTAAAVACLSVSAAAPGYAAPSETIAAPLATLTMTSPALAALATGDLTVEPIQPAADTVTTRTDRRAFTMPVMRVSYGRQGRVKSVLLAGGLRVVGESVSIGLSQLQVQVPARQASVRVSSTSIRVPAFDVTRLKATKKKVRGVLVIAPGTSAVLNKQFNTYVFVDGLRFATFESRL